MHHKKKAVLVTSRLPFPQDSGFSHKNYHLIKTLSETRSVTLIVIDRCRPDITDIEKSRAIVDSLIFIKSPEKLFLIFELLKCGLLGLPLQFAFFNSSKLRKVFRKECKSAELVVGSVARVWPTIKNFKGDIFVDAADSLSVIFRNNAKNHSSVFGRLYYWWESLWIVGVERSMVQRCRAVCVFNPEEAKFLHQFGASARLIQHGVGESFLQSSLSERLPEYRNDIVIFGKMNFLPNVDAVLWFAQTVLPLLPPSIRLVALGASPSDKLVAMSKTNPRLIVTGFVEDPAPILASALASVAPVKLGGGIQNKVIESLAAGARVIVSEQVMRSMPDFTESGAIVCRSVEDWRDRIMALYEQNASENTDRILGRDYVRRNFSWQAYKESLREILIEIGGVK